MKQPQLKYFTVDRSTTHQDLEKQKKDLNLKYHPDAGLGKSAEQLAENENILKEINGIEYPLAQKIIRYYTEIRILDQKAKAILEALLDSAIDCVPDDIIKQYKPAAIVGKIIGIGTLKKMLRNSKYVKQALNRIDTFRFFDRFGSVFTNSYINNVFAKLPETLANIRAMEEEISKETK